MTGTSGPAAGRFLDSCRIDLPADDVVEEIAFERFFRLNVLLGALQGPAGPSLDIARPKLADGEPEAGAADVDVKALPLALYMPFKQQWILDGYTRGRVVNSFSLGPGEEQIVEVFTWDRLQTSLDSSSSFDSEQTTESSGSRRDTADISRDIARQTGFELTTGGKVGFTVGVVNADLSAGMTARAGVNDAEKTTRNSIIEATSRSASQVRASRTLKVTESRESGREERVTRKLRNPNICHTLTVPFFEVLANYRVATFVRTSEVRLVALIRSALLSNLVSFDRQGVRAHETSLRLALLDRALAPGFDAARLLDAKDRACSILCKGCSCGDDPNAETTNPEWDAVVAAARTIADAVNRLRTTSIRFPLSVPTAVPPPFGAGVTPQLVASSVDDIKRYLFKKTLASNAPRLLIDLAAAGVAGGTASVSFAQARALAAVVASVAPRMAQLRFDAGVSDAVSAEIYAAILLIVPEFITAGVLTAGVRNAAGGLTTYNDDGLLDAITAFSTAYDAWTKTQAATRAEDAKRAELARIAKDERERRILESFGLRETADAEERLQALLDHLNDPRNIDHYRFAVWNERAGSSNDTVTTLALAGLIDPTPVGIVGDQLAVPIRLDREARLSAFFTDSIADLVAHTVRDERRHILPTAALYAEAVVGQCCACEPEISERRQLEVDQLRVNNDLLQLEKQRLKARLDARPPLLDKEFPPQLKCCVVCAASPQEPADGTHGHEGHDPR